MPKIKAEIMPIDSKYYGTKIQLTSQNGVKAYVIVWINSISSNYFPSEREYDFIGQDGKAYILEDGEAWEYEICDDHMETQAAYDICKKIVEAINGMEIA